MREVQFENGDAYWKQTQVRLGNVDVEQFTNKAVNEPIATEFDVNPRTGAVHEDRLNFVCKRDGKLWVIKTTEHHETKVIRPYDFVPYEDEPPEG